MATLDITDFGAIADTTGTISVNSNQLTVAKARGVNYNVTESFRLY